MDTGRGQRQRTANSTPFLSIYRLVLRLDEYLYAQGIAPPENGLSRSVRLSLVEPNSPWLIPSREPQDTEALSAYVLELDDFEITATARQQGRGGFWGELVVGETINAQANGFLVRRGENSVGAFWFATHLLQVRSGAARVPLVGAPRLFLYLSLEDALIRSETSFNGLSVLPGAGFGLRWKVRTTATVTFTSGANGGVWFSLKNEGSLPAFSIAFATVTLDL